MSISYPLTLPTTPAPKAVTIGTMTQVGINRSPYTFTTLVQAYAGKTLVAEVVLPLMKERADAEKWICFLLKLNGEEGTFLLGNPVSKTPRGTANGNPKVNGSGQQTGVSLLNTKGWAVNSNGVLLEGDEFQVGNRLYKVLNDVNSDGSGNATIDIFPGLRESPADNDTLNLYSPKGLFRLASSENKLFDADEAKIYNVSFSCVEAI